VALLNRVAPELDIRLGDVRELPIEDASLAAYWSLGVIEHFYQGYEGIAMEMARVIRPGGYLFLTFPYMSPLRRLKARLGIYQPYDKHDEPSGFYQFALDAKVVAEDFNKLGFQLVMQKGLSGLKGVKDEVKLVRLPLQSLYDFRGSSLIVRGFRWFLDQVMSPVAGHICLMVFRRR
jgi:SAM-dependent methyltransferase